MKGADPDAPFVVVTAAVEFIAGIATSPTIRPEWSPDNVTWTRGDLQSLPLAVGTFAQLGISIKPGVVRRLKPFGNALLARSLMSGLLVLPKTLPIP